VCLNKIVDVVVVLSYQLPHPTMSLFSKGMLAGTGIAIIN